MKPEELKRAREKAAADLAHREKSTRFEIRVDMGTSGIAAGSRAVLEAFQRGVAARGLDDVSVIQTGERGWASCEPVAEIRERDKDPVFYSCLTAPKVERILEEHIVAGTPVADYQIHPAG